MSINLLDLFKDQISGAVTDKISNFIGEDSSKTSSAMSGIAATLLGSVAGKASSSSGAASIMSMLSGHDGSALNNIGSALSGGNTDSLLSGGSSIVNSLLGNNVGKIVSAISGSSGISQKSSSTLMNLAGPLVMGFLGKYVKEKALGASGLMSLLSSQKSSLQAALPAGLGSMVNFDGLGNAAGKAAGDAAESGGNMLKKLLPWLLFAIIAFAGFSWFKSCNKSENKDTVAEVVVDSTSNVGNNANDDMNTNDDNSASTSENSDDITAEATATTEADAKKVGTKGYKAGTVAYDINEFLTSGSGTKSFVLTDVAAEGEGLSEAGAAQLDMIAAILEANPGARAVVEAHAAKGKNGAEDLARKAATKARALFIKGKLVFGRNIPGKDVDAKGFGSDQPMANIPSEDDRQKRVVISITK